VAMDDDQHRNLVMRGGPQRARRIHQIAVADDAGGQLAMRLVGQRRADDRAAAIALAGAAGIAVVVIDLGHVPEPLRPIAEEGLVTAAGEGPILVADRFPQFGAKPPGADWTGIPGARRLVA